MRDGGVKCGSRFVCGQAALNERKAFLMKGPSVSMIVVYGEAPLADISHRLRYDSRFTIGEKLASSSASCSFFYFICRFAFISSVYVRILPLMVW